MPEKGALISVRSIPKSACLTAAWAAATKPCCAAISSLVNPAWASANSAWTRNLSLVAALASALASTNALRDNAPSSVKLDTLDKLSSASVSRAIAVSSSASLWAIISGRVPTCNRARLPLS